MSSSSTEALVAGAEILKELSHASDTMVYIGIMEKLDISDEYLQEIHKELSRLADISIEGDIHRKRSELNYMLYHEEGE